MTFRQLKRQILVTLAFSLIAFLLMSVGVGFLVLALWLWLSDLYDAQFAALIIGGGSIVAGFVVLLSKRFWHKKNRDRVTTRTGGNGSLIEAFLSGFELGSSPRRTR